MFIGQSYMSGVFQNIDHPPPHRPASMWCIPPPPPPVFGARGGHTRWVERGWGVNILEDVRHSSVLYICKYFVGCSHPLIWEEKGRLVLSITLIFFEEELCKTNVLILTLRFARLRLLESKLMGRKSFRSQDGEGWCRGVHVCNDDIQKRHYLSSKFW
jgi:hypothetical protein